MRKLAIVLFFISIIILLASLSLFLFANKIIDEKEIRTSVIVGDSTGFDVNSSALTFGQIVPGGSGTRNLVFSNDYGFPVVLDFEVEGEIKNYLIYHDKVFVGPGEVKKIPFIVIITRDVEKKTYSGSVVLNVKRAFS